MINICRIIINILASLFLLTCIGLPLLILLTACQSSINQAQQEHKSTVDKWQALMQYGESSLPDYGIHISAQLSQLPIKYINSPLNYQLGNIKLNNNNNFNHINLLSPWFDNKYICSPVCSQLTEYKSKTNRGNSTLLNYYFEQYQYELYDFYAQIYKVNSQLSQLHIIQPLLVKDYLFYLVDQQAPQSSLVAFIELLDQSLSPKAYQDYLLDPKLRISEYQPSNEGLPNIQAHKQTVKERDFWQDTARHNSEGSGWQKMTDNNIENIAWKKMADNNIENIVWKKMATYNIENIAWKKMTDNNIETLAWKKMADNNIENIVWKKMVDNSDNQIPNHQVKQAGKTIYIPSHEEWKNSKNNILAVGDLACSYQYNMFGKVISIADVNKNKNGVNIGSNVTLSLFGQAKKIEDGVTSSHVSGYLFNTGQQAVSFKPIKGIKTFSADNISQCQFK